MYVLKVINIADKQGAIGKRAHVNVFGNDYGTKDGTGVRDYIHVVDLVLGHMAALVHLPNVSGCCLQPGHGHRSASAGSHQGWIGVCC
jgi:UDP-glucose 4-epimerase